MSRFLTRGVAAGIASLWLFRCHVGRCVRQQDCVDPGRSAPLFRALGTGRRRRQEGLRHCRRAVQGAGRVEARAADRTAQQPAAQGFNAFGCFPGDAVASTPIAELKANNIPAVALGGCAQDPTDTVFCMATDVYASAYQGTKSLIAAMGGKGAIVHLAGLLVDPNTTLRVKAVETAVAETNGAVTLLQTVGDTDNQEQGDQKINALLAAQKDQIGGMIATGYISSVVAATALKNLGDKRIKFIGIDDDKIVLDGIRDGFVSRHHGAEPLRPGLYRRLRARPVGERLHRQGRRAVDRHTADGAFHRLGTLLISAANVDTYKDDLKKLTADMQPSSSNLFERP